MDNYFIDSFGFTKPFWAIKRVIQAVYTDKHLCTHEYVPVSCCPRPSQKPPTLVFFTEYHFFKPIMLFTKLFSRSFFNERMLFFSLLLQPLTLSRQWLNLPSHVEKQLSHEHINVWAAQIFIFVTGPSNTQIMKMKSSS